VLLLDAINGTCFNIEVFFEAFSPWEETILRNEGMGDYADE